MLIARISSCRNEVLFAALFFGLTAPAVAERPVNVDDAGTLERGGAKVEMGWSKDDAVRGFDGAVGYGPIDNVEVELAFGRFKDRDPSPDATIREVGAALKWVPLQSEIGLSAGMKYEYSRESQKGESNSHANAVLGLVTWAFESGPRVHVNLGREWARDDGNINLWGVAADFPITERLEFAVETFGEEHSGPDRQVGLRYEIVEGLKVSGAVGRGNGRNIANAGLAWEF